MGRANGLAAIKTAGPIPEGGLRAGPQTATIDAHPHVVPMPRTLGAPMTLGGERVVRAFVREMGSGGTYLAGLGTVGPTTVRRVAPIAVPVVPMAVVPPAKASAVPMEAGASLRARGPTVTGTGGLSRPEIGPGTGGQMTHEAARLTRKSDGHRDRIAAIRVIRKECVGPACRPM